MNSKILLTVLSFGLVTLYSMHPALAIQAEARTSDEPLGLILTWQQDPTTTMTIDWHTKEDDNLTALEYKRIGTDEWKSVQGETSPFPFSYRITNRVELTGLTPNTEYRFRFTDTSTFRKFKTMPVDSYRPIRFAAGGDVRHSVEMMDRTNRQAAAYSPDFIVWGGDLAYADGREDRVDRWFEFMESTMNTLVTDDGRIIPVIAGIGNHEVLGHSYRADNHASREGMPPYAQNDEMRELIAPYYYNLFAFPGQPGYGVLDFENYMSFILLDTGHSNPIAGEQTEWLEKVISERKHVTHVFPIYHVPAYPSVRSPYGSGPTAIRENWVPLFEEGGVKVAFEKHDHAYKRTYPMLNGEIHENGIVYIGDGAWGVGTRPIGGGDDPDYWTYHGEDPWYLKRASSERHFILTTIHGTHSHFLMINEDGVIIDEYPDTSHRKLNIRRMAEPWTGNASDGDSGQ